MFNVYLSLGIDGISYKMAKGKYTKKSYSKKGKWYSYSKINYLLSNNTRIKLCLTLYLGHWNMQDGWIFRTEQTGGGQTNFPQVDLGNLMKLCNAWEAFRLSWQCFRVRGVLLEFFPMKVLAAYANSTAVLPTTMTPWIGSVAVGIFGRGGGANAQEIANRRLNYSEIVEGDHAIILDVTQRQRLYMKFNQYDYTNVPPTVDSNPYCPGYLQMNTHETAGQADPIYPE